MAGENRWGELLNPSLSVLLKNKYVGTASIRYNALRWISITNQLGWQRGVKSFVPFIRDEGLFCI